MSGSRDSLAGTLGSSALTIYQGMAVDGAEMDTMDRMDLVDPKRWPKGESTVHLWHVAGICGCWGS